MSAWVVALSEQLLVLLLAELGAVQAVAGAEALPPRQVHERHIVIRRYHLRRNSEKEQLSHSSDAQSCQGTVTKEQASLSARPTPKSAQSNNHRRLHSTVTRHNIHPYALSTVLYCTYNRTSIPHTVTTGTQHSLMPPPPPPPFPHYPYHSGSIHYLRLLL